MTRCSLFFTASPAATRDALLARGIQAEVITLAYSGHTSDAVWVPPYAEDVRPAVLEVVGSAVEINEAPALSLVDMLRTYPAYTLVS